MTRVVKRDATGPLEITVGGESKWICMCGLSNGQPFCDGSHKKTAGEEEGKIYLYSKDGTRKQVSL
ncbi:CDGSH iron-sulfur domain-containing protein [Candidatus Nitrosotenuis cloacae]|jgi:CDGSH iron-sulfur domain-containing protein 3|uniref:CDGSH iron-sulfur domain-containing protein n=1 Tax=Candidatus Nitrosotenuis cloacae TaxID=1603555 RepID=UPI0022825C66|nr:CDGSH iron-sulfur domain-containing protein [Candidatus Nitrosotenuis cloacae]